jgi:DUF4097 and DUF4098 domain-containing protein YvlB
VIDRELTVDESPTVRIAIRSGRVNVEGGDPGVVRFMVDTNDPTFEIRQGADAIVAEGGRGGRAFVTVSVPPMADVEIGTGSGSVDIDPPVGRLDVTTVSGKIDFDSATRLQARTTSGGIRGNRVDGEALVVTTSGDIKLSEILDRADLSSSSGSVVIGSCAGTVSCATLSGNVRIGEMTGPSAKIKSMSGGVRLGIPPKTRLELDANTLSGKVSLPSPNPSPEPPEREISLKVRLVSGNLKIERLGT